MTPDDAVCPALDAARACIDRGDYIGAYFAIGAAEKAWRVEVDFWTAALFEAEKAARDA